MEDMKMTHTAGPWKLIDEDGVYIAGPLGFEGDPTDRRVIANLWEPGENTEWLGDEDFANYQLMATSPALLKACEDALYWFENAPYIRVGGEDEQIERLRTAIAEAKVLSR
jgi:hypothetical protein